MGAHSLKTYRPYYVRSGLEDKQAKNSIQGRINRAAGRGFEERIDIAFDYYRKMGYALIDKTPEPMKVIKREDGGRFIGFFTKKAQPDYKGLVKGGKAVLFEAKFTSTDKMHSGALTDTQIKYLMEASNLGAQCFILVGFKTGNVYKIPWPVWFHMKERFGRKYVKEDDLEEYIVSQTKTGVLMILGRS